MRKFILSSAALLTAMLATSAPALAADLPSVKEAPAPVLAPIPSGWRFEATVNGWAPSIISNVGVAGFPTSSVDVGFFKILSKLNGVVPLSLIARNDTFIAGVDLYWSALSAGASFRGPAALTTFGGVNANLHTAMTILTGFGGVRLPLQIANLNFYGIAGARYFGVNNTLGLSAPVAGYGLSATQGKDWVDPIIGFASRYVINEKWFVDAEADIGGYNKSVTWQTFAAVGYNWTQNISSTVGFRALYVDYEKANNFNGSFRFQQTLLGPQATIIYAF
ncbi:hypothetical protein QM467_03460 [Rhodoblastus sp. 17X3]|uniref:hypothetical protein n=1 Tax=Rhodoblastus sp. 17X3 TaxID=3047026 RepID=UPI0024B6FDBB|nr:hypothetical protein [Rhodoblastus sp. 17X3]MDI9847117.1 hypothetical protein [Rhodoblastus sp. 17X3]